MNRHKSEAAALRKIKSIPRSGTSPVFTEPWEAQAFAMTLALFDAGHFTWQEWADKLSEKLSAAGPKQDGGDYYKHWMSALEEIVAEKRIVALPELQDRKLAWDRAAKATPHGEAIELGREER